MTDAGEVRFGFQTFIESFSLLPIFIGGGMRTVDLSVPAKGFKVHDGQVFKVLASYDGAFCLYACFFTSRRIDVAHGSGHRRAVQLHENLHKR